MTIPAILLVALAAVPYRAPDGGGAFDPALARDDVPALERARVDAEVARNAAALAPRAAAPAALLFDWPLRATPGYAEPDYHGVSNFVDLNAAYPGYVLDYACGARSYDLDSGYNHSGVDYFLWPFPWLLMDQGAIEVVAAAPGTIVARVDGNDDRSCPGHYSADWNLVAVRHADDTVAWYGHLRKSSLVAKNVGESVALGERLGLVGSSGFSTGPHLHFELHSSSQPGYAVMEGNTGACNHVLSRYVSQRPYVQSRINRLATHAAPPVLDAGCPSPGEETPNFKTTFAAGEALVVAAYYHDQQSGQETSYRIVRPDASVFASWAHAAPGTYAASYWYWSYALPAGAPAGTWTFEATYEGVVTRKDFTVAESLFGDGFE